MNLTALQTFVTILETGSLVRASERLHVTQSTVTARLKALEDTLGQTLINRHKSGATPTGSGLRLKRYAETMTELWGQARKAIALPTNVSAVCNIGCHADLWPGRGERLFDAIRMREPTVALSVWHGGHGELAQWLASGLIDLSLGYSPATQSRQSVTALPTDRLILVATKPDAPLRFNPSYVYIEAGEEFGRAHAASYSDADMARISFGSATLGLAHILKHGGSAYLPERLAAPLLADGSLHRLPDAPEFDRAAYLVYSETSAARWPWFDDIRAEVASARN